MLVNPTGAFELGGPHADCGLTGRKIIVDTYGGMARHGGGAFSGKDPTKVDRSAAYAVRHVAKNVVAAGIAPRCEVQVAYAIGVAHPVSVMVETFGTSEIDPEKLPGLVQEYFDLRPAAIIERLDLRRPIYRNTAAYGHFGRDDRDFTWERTDHAERAAEGRRGARLTLDSGSEPDVPAIHARSFDVLACRLQLLDYRFPTRRRARRHDRARPAARAAGARLGARRRRRRARSDRARGCVTSCGRRRDGPPPDVVDLCRWAAWRWAGPVASFLRAASAPNVVAAGHAVEVEPGGVPGRARLRTVASSSS